MRRGSPSRCWRPGLEAAWSLVATNPVPAFAARVAIVVLSVGMGVVVHGWSARPSLELSNDPASEDREPAKRYLAAAAEVRRAGRWNEVDAPLLLSRFAKSFAAAAPIAATAVLLADLGWVRAIACASVGALGVLSGRAVSARYRGEHVRRVLRLAGSISPTPQRAGGEAPEPSAVGLPVASPLGAPAPANRQVPPWIIAVLAAAAGGWLASALVAAPPPLVPASTELRQLAERQEVAIASVLGELKSIRSVLERPPPTRETVVLPELDSAPPTEPPGAGARRLAHARRRAHRRRGRPHRAGGIAAVRGGDETRALRIPLATAVGTIGALLSAGGVTLSKDTKLASFDVHDVLKLVHQEIVAPAAGPEPMGSITGFVPGRDDQVEGDLSKAISDTAGRWIANRDRGRDGVLVIVGSTDRTPLSVAAAARFESNVGLARARAETVKRLLLAEIRSKHTLRSQDTRPRPDPEVLVLVSGPRTTPPVGAGARPEGSADDRRVDVWAFWNARPQEQMTVEARTSGQDASAAR